MSDCRFSLTAGSVFKNRLVVITLLFALPFSLNACAKESQVVPPSKASVVSSTPSVTRITPPADVLFIGNSFTYYNDSLHKHVRLLLRAGKPLGDTRHRIRSMTLSGARLVEHSAGFEAIVDSHSWDAVVMQGHSLGPISEETKQSFQDTARAFDRYLDEQGIQSALFMTWAYTGAPEMTQKLDKSYTETGNELNALVVPVGRAFARVTQNHADIPLRISDKKHPSLAGSYLAACVFYASLYGQSPVGLSYTAGLDKAVAFKLQEAAADSVEEYFGYQLE
ncbi:MAG: DUF4886 domain-containing protein [Gammaproteobacteria bacterium]